MVPPDSQDAGKNDEAQEEEGLDPRLDQANKLFQTGVMLIYGRKKSVERAIKCVQRAIVLDDSNYKYWQLLGEAYYQRGSLNPAINCFMKSLERAEQHLTKSEANDQERKRVQSDSTYSKIRMSDIRLSVLHLDEAMQGYSDIIECDPKNVAALTGLSRTKLQLARNCFSNGLVKSGHEHCMEALKYALRATCLSPHLCFTWKLASDCCLIQILFGPRGDFKSIIDVPEYPGAEANGLLIDQLTCIELAQQFLCKALGVGQFKESACLWHNLGVSLYLNYTLIKGNSSEENDQKKSLLKKSLKCLLKALDFDRNNSQVRNSIALVSFHLNLLNTAQNFLIKSIQTNMSTSEMQFSNLGYIFLQKGELRLASVAFKRSQAEEPLYCRSWLGNALLSELSNSDNMTFLRHCHKLENNYESQLMYATKVVSLPHKEEFSKDLTNALDCMRRIINYNHLSLEGQNTMGLLLERCKFIHEARQCFEMANAMAPNDSRALLNRLRLLESSNSRSEQVQQSPEFIKSAERLADGGSKEYMLNFIYYQFRKRNFQEVRSRVATVIEKLSQDNVSDKIGAQILLAMADKMDERDFKSWLFKNIIDSEQTICIESLISLFCLLLFGSQTNDQDLFKQVGKDLMKSLFPYLSSRSTQFSELFYSLEGYWTRILLFSSIFINQGNLIRPVLALFPMIADLWLYLGLSLMSTKDQIKLRTAKYCIAKANLIGSTDPNLTSVCDILLAILCDQIVGKKMDSSKRQSDRETHLCRALFKGPDNELLWDCLLKSKATRESPEVENGALFQFAVDHALRTLIIR